jgi:hypothetical protein
MKRTFLISLIVIANNAFAQSFDSGKGFSYSIEMSGNLSDGSHAPFWLTANRYGLSSIERNSGYVRGSVFQSTDTDSLRNWETGYGIDMYLANNHTADLFVQQMYMDVRWMKGLLTIGAKQQPMQLKNHELSSGPQTLGINAHPYPEIR